MTETKDGDSSRDEYRGSLTLPGEQEPHDVSMAFDSEAEAVTIRFDAPVAGESEWSGSSVRVARRLKYLDVQFTTTGLPKETVELAWKCNASLLDDTLAGVVVARPNDVRVSGEKGFTLVKLA